MNVHMFTSSLRIKQNANINKNLLVSYLDFHQCTFIKTIKYHDTLGKKLLNTKYLTKHKCFIDPS